MKVLVDTSIWSLALRRHVHELTGPDLLLRNELLELVEEGRVEIIGLVRQELLSGIRHHQQYLRLRDRLRAFSDEPMNTVDYEEAARASNQCRAAGIIGSASDFLLCAVALERGWEVFTRDADFQHYSRIVPVRLHRPRNARN